MVYASYFSFERILSQVFLLGFNLCTMIFPNFINVLNKG